jgi:hypothetical protein
MQAQRSCPYSRTRPFEKADPFDRSWVETELRTLAERARHRDPGARRGPGVPDPHDQLLEALWPWALRTARAQAARLPVGADRDAVSGEILWEVFQAVRRIDWQRYNLWPALLKARIRAAWSTAARAEDPLTRRERQARTAYLASVEAETQRLGRSLTGTERYAIARLLRPVGDTAAVVLGRQLCPTAAVPDPACPAAVAADDDPVVLLQRAYLCCAVRMWIARDLPPELGHEVSALLDRDEVDHLSPAMRRRLHEYVAELQRRVDE